MIKKTYGVDNLNCCITELRCKEVINKANGSRLGPVSDIEVDSCSGKVVSIILLGRPRYWGIFGKREKIRIRWEDIDVIGKDTVLVCKAPCEYRRR